MLLIGDILRRAARAAPERVAVSFRDEALTFGQLDAAANRLAHALRGRGVARGDRIAWWGDTCLDAVALFFGLAKLGAVFVPVNARLSAEEAEPVLKRARPRLSVADEKRTDGSSLPIAQLTGAMTRDSDASDPRIDERDPHVIFFTSGSTGEPKGAVLSHRADYLRTFRGTEADFVPGPTVCMFPLFHMASWTIALGCWQQRRQVCLVEAADAETLLPAVQRWRAARLYCIPAVWRRILDGDLKRWDLSCLRVADTGTSATPPELIESIKRALPGTVTRVFYGSTEAGLATILSDEDLARKPGSVGPAVPGVELRLAEGNEVCVRSEYLFDGYFEDPEATAGTLRDGWYHTGDRGALDDEGYLSIVGRLSDAIRTGGETVSPAEIERAIAAHSSVADCAVVGVPDAEWGEIVCAVVVPKQGATLSLEELRSHCAGLAPFKRPRRLELVHALPRTAATGQVQRTLLVERLAAGGR